MTKIGVVGCGSWGGNLVRTMHELGALHAVSDANPATAAAAAERYSVTALDYPALLADPEIEGVVLATPAHLHAEHALAAIAAGKHVYVEKPIALKPDDAKTMIAAAEKADRVLMVGHLLQYHAAFRKLLELVRSGEFGSLRYVYSNRLNIGKLRTEEDVLWSFAPHDLSMIIALAGEKPSEVTGLGSAFLQPLSDFATVHLAFPSGVRAHVFVSWLHPFKEQKLVAVCENAMIVFDDTCDWSQKLMCYRHEARIDKGAPHLVKASGEPIALEPSEPLKDECRHFLSCVAENRRPLTDGEEALRVLDVLSEASVRHA